MGYCSVDAATFVNSADNTKQIFVSFDDNYQDWHTALPLLNKMGIKATFYTNTLPFRDRCHPAEVTSYFKRIGYKGSGPTLSTTELQEISSNGHEIGCHSHSHFALSNLDLREWDKEIKDCRKILEDITQKPIKHFAYPYGMRRHFSRPLREYCRGLGFETVAAATPGFQQCQVRDPFNLYRTGWRFDRSLKENIEDLCIDGRLFEYITGRSAIG
jgi:peptidoglycan/xylan/chitin deacetylase (PgdA/CDA1 family)